MLLQRATIVARSRSMGICGALLVCLGLSSTVSADEQRFAFDIPAQSLEFALDSYGSITGRDVLYDGRLTIGRRSTAVRGLLPADTALMILLEGSGVEARHETSGSFVLLGARPADRPAHPPAISQYYGQLQVTLRRALCADRDARPGSYRIAAQFWIGASGDILRYRRLSSTGVRGVDEGLDNVLSRLRVGAPPLGVSQPVTMVIAPQAPGKTMACDVRDVRVVP